MTKSNIQIEANKFNGVTFHSLIRLQQVLMSKQFYATNITHTYLEYAKGKHRFKFWYLLTNQNTIIISQVEEVY